VSDAPMDTTTPGPGAKRVCTAKRSNGEACNKPPIKGGTVCATHGGSAPQVRRKAALRLLELVDPAIAVLAREMVQADKSADRQRAANSVLDRAGVPRTATVIDGESAKALLVERINALRGEAELPAMTPDEEDAL
jgi:hypothetical protein